jgi:hypothetical protein
MKKIYILFLSTILSHSVFSQALPNPGFETWNNMGGYDDPANWNTLNSLTYQLGVITVQAATGADIHSGAAAIKLTTIPVGIQNANGLATTGTINVAGMTVDGGLPYTSRPDSIVGWYKCNPLNGDFGFVDFTLLDASGTDTVAFAHFQTPAFAITTYTRFSIALNYHNANTPALSRCVISSSAGTSAVAYSELVIDDLELIFNASGISESVFAINTFSYNPSNHKLQIFTHESGHIAVCDMTGKKVSDHKIEKGYSEIPLETIPKGLYLYMFSGNSTGQSSSGKFISE